MAAACYATQRRAAEPLNGFDILAECCQEGEQLEGGAGLTQGLDPVEAALAVVAAAHIGKDRAVAHIEADQGGLIEAHRAASFSRNRPTSRCASFWRRGSTVLTTA